MIVLRDIEVIASVARYYTLTRAQINRLHYPTDHDGRLTRKRLRLIHEAELINRTHMQVTNPSMGAPAYVYYPSAKGCAFLAQELKDEKYKSVCTRTPSWMHLYHWVEVAQVHITLDQAIAQTTGTKLDEWLSEWTIANPDEEVPDKRFRLYVKLGQKLVCKPDAGFLLDTDGFRKTFYIELDRDTTQSSDRVAAQKCHGYAGLYEQRMHISRHFPTTNVEKFSVLFVTPTPRRRDALAKSFSTRPAPWLYKFCSQTELSAETFLNGPIWHTTHGLVAPLIKERSPE